MMLNGMTYRLSLKAVLLRLVFIFAFVKFYNGLQLRKSTHGARRYLSKRNMNLQMSGSKPLVALTREDGANDKLRNLLPGISCVEIPCLTFIEGEDYKDLPSAMTSHNLIVITSPQAATTFLNSWRDSGKPTVKVATVGKGTSKPLIAAGIHPVFEPSDSTAETLAAELPTSFGTSILYPSSAIAENTLARGLESRGFKVTRLNTYNTVPAVWTKEQQELAQNVDIVTIASPSAAKIWSEAAGTNYTAVVIGPTSRKAAQKAGYKEVICPEGGSQGIEAWAKLIIQTVEQKSCVK